MHRTKTIAATYSMAAFYILPQTADRAANATKINKPSTRYSANSTIHSSVGVMECDTRGSFLNGSVKRKTEPWPTTLSAPTSPPWA